MNPTFFHLLVAYGLCFGLQNKAAFLRNRFDWLDALLACSYCTGFHAGWMVWILSWASTGKMPVIETLSVPASVLCWAFASSAVCYLTDVAATRLER